MSFIKSGAFGGIIGFLNGLLGAGGGMVAVPVLKKEMDTKQAHATSIAVIIPMSIFSAASYLLKGSVTIQDAFPYIPGGIYFKKDKTEIYKKGICPGYAVGRN